jgi:hypothetical protein
VTRPEDLLCRDRPFWQAAQEIDEVPLAGSQAARDLAGDVEDEEDERLGIAPADLECQLQL